MLLLAATNVQLLGLIDDVDGSESLAELDVLLTDAEQDYPGITKDPDVVESTQLRRDYFASTMTIETLTQEVGLRDRLAQLEKQLASMSIAAQPKQVVVHSSRSYRLLSFDVGWSTKPQVHAIAKILQANFALDAVVDESLIVAAMESNKHILETRQTGKRIWDYYKGDHTEGLLMHGNVQKL